MAKNKRYSGMVLLENARDSQIDSPATISGSWQEGSRRVELSGPTHVEPSGQYITADDVLRAARAQGTLRTKAEKLERDFAIVENDESEAALAELEHAPLSVEGVNDAHVDVYYPATYAVPVDEVPGRYVCISDDGELIASSLGAWRHGYRYLLSLNNIHNVSFQAHRTDAATPYYEVNGPKREFENGTVLA